MKYSETTAVPKLFIGMDVHKKGWTVHFKTDLFDNKTVTMPADPSVLISYVENNFAGHDPMLAAVVNALFFLSNCN